MKRKRKSMMKQRASGRGYMPTGFIKRFHTSSVPVGNLEDYLKTSIIPKDRKDK
jgi:hypothetical protein